jgi:hypothetical protein
MVTRSVSCEVQIKAIHVTGRGGPYFLENRLIDGGEVVMLRPPFTPRKIPGTHFC